MEDQLCKGREMVLQSGLLLSIGGIGSGVSGWCRSRSAPTCFMFMAILPELYSNLRLLLLVLGLEIPRQSQAVNLGWLPLVPCLGSLSKRYREWDLTDTYCCLVERI